MYKKTFFKIARKMEYVALNLRMLQLEQDYELLTLFEAMKIDDKKQIMKSKRRLSDIHFQIELIKSNYLLSLHTVSD